MSEPYRSECADARKRREAEARLQRIAEQAAAPLKRDLNPSSSRWWSRDILNPRWWNWSRWMNVLGSILGPALSFSSMGVAVVTPCGLGTLWLGMEERLWWLAALGAVGCALGPAYLALMVLLYRRELRYASTLPFAVQGYEAALASDNRDSAVLTVEVRMAIGAPPDSELCTKVFGTLAESVVVSGSGVLITSPALPCPYGDSGSYNNKLRLWLRALLTRVLMAFHSEFPIGQVIIAMKH